MNLNVISAMEDSGWKVRCVRKRTMTDVCNVTSDIQSKLGNV